MIEEAFKQGDVAGRVRRMRTQKRPLNLAALGVLGPAQGAAPESRVNTQNTEGMLVQD